MNKDRSIHVEVLIDRAAASKAGVLPGKELGEELDAFRDEILGMIDERRVAGMNLWSVGKRLIPEGDVDTMFELLELSHLLLARCEGRRGLWNGVLELVERLDRDIPTLLAIFTTWGRGTVPCRSTARVHAARAGFAHPLEFMMHVH